KHQMELKQAVAENSFGEGYDPSRVHLFFTNDEINGEKLNKLLHQDFGDEDLRLGSQCLYMYLPRYALKKKLNTNYLEKQLDITATM
ncbi:DUF1697 domain-containing protein, partial [Streptococcus suis]